MNPKNDFRNIENGTNIPKENYCDQPYVVIRNDGASGIELVRFYDRDILTNDAVGNYRYDTKKDC